MPFNRSKLLRRYPDVKTPEIKWVHAMHEILDRGPITEKELRDELVREYGAPWPKPFERKFKNQLSMELKGRNTIGGEERQKQTLRKDDRGRLVIIPPGWKSRKHTVVAATNEVTSPRRREVAVDQNFSGELHPDKEYVEGAVTQVLVNRYERDPKARATCLQKLGYNCSVCGFCFSQHYGEIGDGFIHVHHRKPLSLRKAQYRLNPTADLAPVCPNCHAMLHSSDPPLEIDELRDIWEKHRGNRSRSTR